MRDEVEIRYVTEADFPEWAAGCNRGFLRSEPIPADAAARISEAWDLDPARTLGAFDGGRCVGTFRSIPRRLTLPGGATVPASGVTSVTVTATHRRRGLLNRMMDIELAAAADRGEPVAILIAAEYAIYGRYGFGPATWTTEWSIDLPRARREPYRPPAGGRIDLATPAEVREFGPALFDRVRLATPGAIDRPPVWWRTFTGDLHNPARPWEEPFFAVYRDAAGRPDGLLTYTVDQSPWQGKMPDNTLTVRKAEFATPEAETALWRYALSTDWIVRLVSGYRPPDDVLPLLLGDPRAAGGTHADFLWLRVLDPVAALRARGYNAPGSLVLRIRDAAGHADGVFRLDAAVEPGASTVTPTTGPADLDLDVADLATLYLGDESAARLTRLNRAREVASGAATRTDALFRTTRRPWCPDIF